MLELPPRSNSKKGVGGEGTFGEWGADSPLRTVVFLYRGEVRSTLVLAVGGVEVLHHVAAPSLSSELPPPSVTLPSALLLVFPGGKLHSSDHDRRATAPTEDYPAAGGAGGGFSERMGAGGGALWSHGEEFRRGRAAAGL